MESEESRMTCFYLLSSFYPVWYFFPFKFIVWRQHFAAISVEILYMIMKLFIPFQYLHHILIHHIMASIQKCSNYDIRFVMMINFQVKKRLNLISENDDWKLVLHMHYILSLVRFEKCNLGLSWRTWTIAHCGRLSLIAISCFLIVDIVLS